MPQLGEISTWIGFVAPHGTPAAILAQLQRSIAKAAEQDDMRQKLLKFGIVATSSTPEEFRSYIKSEIGKMVQGHQGERHGIQLAVDIRTCRCNSLSA